MKNTYNTILFTIGLLLATVAVSAQTGYFRIIDGIPHLPVVANTAAVTSPVTGAMVFSQADALALVYNGTAWYGLCELPDPETTGSATYFRVVSGLPCMAVLSSASGTGTQSGMVYYAASGAEGIKIFNGSAYVLLTDGFTGGTANAEAAVLTGGDKLLSIPVLSTAPVDVEAGAVYLDNTAGQFMVYDGSTWLPLVCDCPPQATAVLAPANGEPISENTSLVASYTYYDKENDDEGASVIEWYMAADSTGNNDGSAVFTGSTYNYTYQITDNGKYFCYTVTPVAATGTPAGDVVKSTYTLINNCPPMASGLTLSGTLTVGSTLSVGYVYSDKEDELSPIYQWYWATSSTGTNATAIPGATAQSYTLGSADRWNYIGASVTPQAISGPSPGDEVAAYTATTVPGPPVCPSTTLTIVHTAGSVAPVDQTITYQLVETDLGTPLLAKQCWLVQNLGASTQASSATDVSNNAAGWYWQFNRKQGYKMDGIWRTPNTYWPENINENSDWTVINDPCHLLLGGAWRLPTRSEWSNADSNGSWSNYNHTFGSVLKLHAAGFLTESVDWIHEPGNFGSYWSSTQYSNNQGYYLFLNADNAYTNNYNKARGYTVRCLMEN